MLPSLLLLIAPQASTTWWISDAAEFDTALGAAQSGDVLLLTVDELTPYFDLPGVAQGVTLASAAPSGRTTLWMRFGLEVSDLTVDETFVLRDVDIRACSNLQCLEITTALGPAQPALQIEDCLGSVRIEDSTLKGGTYAPAVEIESSAGLAVVGSQLKAGDVDAYNSQIPPGSAPDASPALRVENSRVWIADSVLEATDGDFFGPPTYIVGNASPALVLESSSALISGTSIIAGVQKDSSCFGYEPAIVGDVVSDLKLADVQFAWGAGFGPQCPPDPTLETAGFAMGSVVQLADLGSYDAEPATQIGGQPLTLDFEGAAGDVYFTAVTLNAAVPVALGSEFGLWGSTLDLLIVHGVLDASASATVLLPTYDVPAGFSSLRAWAQGGLLRGGSLVMLAPNSLTLL